MLIGARLMNKTRMVEHRKFNELEFQRNYHSEKFQQFGSGLAWLRVLRVKGREIVQCPVAPASSN